MSANERLVDKLIHNQTQFCAHVEFWEKLSEAQAKLKFASLLKQTL